MADPKYVEALETVVRELVESDLRAGELAQQGDKGLREAAVLKGWRRGGKGRGPGTDWPAAAREYADLVAPRLWKPPSEERPAALSPDEAVTRLVERHGPTRDTMLQNLEIQRAEVRRKLAEVIEAGASADDWARDLLGWLAAALEQLPKRNNRPT